MPEPRRIPLADGEVDLARQVARVGVARGAEDRLVGRDAELAKLRGHFEVGARLVTLVGPGGVGKTRLAREVAAPPAIWCELADAADEAQVLRAVAAAIGVRLDGPEPREWRVGLAGALAATPGRLLILDNAEQVVAVVAELAGAWTASCRLLVTSRERLRVPGEHVVPIQPLPHADAVTLFRDRADAAGADDAPADVIDRVVERLDHLPLALELGAGQAAQLGVGGLLATLDDTLAALSAPQRGSPARHGTLRAAVEASWRLLSATEQDGLSRLSVFEGGFTTAAANAVVGSTVLPQLAERSLLHPIADHRFAVYQAARALAAERLVDRDGAERRHAEWFAAEGERLVDALIGPERELAVRSLQADYANLDAAWRRMVGRDGDLAARLALALDRALGLLARTARTRREVLALARRGVSNPSLRVRLLLAEGPQVPEGEALIEEARRLAADQGDVEAEAEAWLALGRRWGHVANRAAAIDALERAQHLAGGNDGLRGRCVAGLAEVWWTYGQVDRALPLCLRALNLHRAAADVVAEARTAATLGHVYRVLGRPDDARLALADATAAAEQLGDPAELARVEVDLALYLTRTGDPAGARAAIEAAARRYAELGLPREGALIHLHLCESLLGVGDLDRAEEEARLAVARLRALPGDVALSVALEALGCVHLLRGRPQEALACLAEGLTLARASGSAQSEATLLGKRGLARMAERAFSEAWDDFDTSRQLHADRGAPTMAGASLVDRGMAALALARTAEGESDLMDAWELTGRPAPTDQVGRMIDLCRLAGNAFGSPAPGTFRGSAATLVRAIDPARYDVALRLGAWIVGVATRG